MSDKNKYICRGIIKNTNKFIYGYPMYSEPVNIWTMIPYTGKKLKDVDDDYICKLCGKSMLKGLIGVEIEPNPDRFITTLDNIHYFENDIIRLAIKTKNLDKNFMPDFYVETKVFVLSYKVFNKIYNAIGFNIELLGNSHLNSITNI